MDCPELASANSLSRYYLSGSIEREGENWILTTELHSADSGRREALREYHGPDLFEVVDEATREMRADLGIPASHIQNGIDLPVAEVTSPDLEAVEDHAAAVALVVHDNDWAGAAPYLEAAVERDPEYALAQFLLFGVYQTLGEVEKSNAAMAAAMENLYRVTERTSYVIKSQYYFNIEQDMDKSIAVLDMWSRIFPNDIEALQQRAMYLTIRRDLAGAVRDYESILEIDPTQYHVLQDIASTYRQLHDYDRAEAALKRYIELFPARADGYDDLSEFYVATGRLDEAREALDQALLLEPGNQSLRMQMIDLELKQGRYDVVAAALERELPRAENDRAHARAHSLRLLLAVNQGRADLAADALDSFYVHMAQVRNPLQLDIIYSLMVPALSICGAPDEAIQRLDAVAARLPAPFDGLTGVGRAWALKDLGRPEEARLELKRATAVVDQYQFETFRATLAMVSGLIERREGNFEAAVEQFRLAIDQAPQNDPNMYVQLAGALRESDDLKEAQRVIEEGLNLHPAHAEGNLERARIEWARGSKDAAAEYLEVALAAWKEASPGYLPAREARELKRLWSLTQ